MILSSMVIYIISAGGKVPMGVIVSYLQGFARFTALDKRVSTTIKTLCRPLYVAADDTITSARKCDSSRQKDDPTRCTFALSNAPQVQNSMRGI